MRLSSVMSFPEMSLEDRFHTSRKGRTGEGEWVGPQGEDSMTRAGLGYRKSYLALGGLFLSSCAQMGLETVLSPYTISISNIEGFCSLDGLLLIKGADYWKLVGVVRVTRLLQGYMYLCEVKPDRT